jgi:glycosyltransferase involved in cell wall biosynthesis
MKISVIIPCRNSADTLAQTIDTVLTQTTSAHEILVVNDRSLDASVQVAAGFGHPVRVLSAPAPGANAARNAGAGASEGDALMFLDADDLLAPNAFTELVRVLASAPGGIACTQWRRYAGMSGIWRSQPPSCEHRGAFEGPLSAWLSGWYHPPCSVLWSRAAFEATGGWTPGLALNQDGDIMMRAIAAGVPIATTGRALTYYRRHGAERASVSSDRTSRPRLEARLQVLHRIADAAGRREQSALARAFARLAEECRAQPDLLEEAKAAERRHGGSRRRHAVSTRIREGDVYLAKATARVKSALTIERLASCNDVDAGRLVDAKPGPSGAPVVSVIIPTYNRAGIVVRAIESVLQQTFTDFEVIVVDDASTDDTANVISPLADRRVRYVRLPHNGGVATARNRGMEEAQGRYFAFLDSDDEWLPTKLQQQIEVFSRAPFGVGLVYTGVETIGEGGASTVSTPEARGYVYPDLLQRNVIHGGASNALIRREAAAIVGGFDASLPAAEDYDFWLRVAQFFLVDFVPAPLSRYHDQTVSRSDERRSLNFVKNDEARRMLHAWYKHDMRAAGVEHGFLLDSVQRHIRANQGSSDAARSWAWCALSAAPLNVATYPWLALAYSPRNLRQRGREAYRRLRTEIGRSMSRVAPQ